MRALYAYLPRRQHRSVASVAASVHTAQWLPGISISKEDCDCIDQSPYVAFIPNQVELAPQKGSCFGRRTDVMSGAYVRLARVVLLAAVGTPLTVHDSARTYRHKIIHLP